MPSKWLWWIDYVSMRRVWELRTMSARRMLVGGNTKTAQVVNADETFALSEEVWLSGGRMQTRLDSTRLKDRRKRGRQ